MSSCYNYRSTNADLQPRESWQDTVTGQRSSVPKAPTTPNAARSGARSRKIIIAARGGGDPRDNLSLRYVIDEAKAANMPKDTINNAIKKGTGELGGENYEERHL